MTEAYIPKVGDRVRATRTVEAVVICRQPDTAQYDAYVGVEALGGARAELFDLDGWTYEKLQDPEPKWVNGDVILINNTVPMIYCNSGEFIGVEAVWACSHCPGGHHSLRQVSEDWQNGDVTILWKQDAA